MTESAAVAPAPVSEQQPAITQEQITALIARKQQEDFDRNDHAERLMLAKRLSTCGNAGNNPLFHMKFDDPSVTYSLDELKAYVPLDRDRVKYIKLALNRHGLFSVPKQTGRRNPRMAKRQQGIKSATLRIFKQLFEQSSLLLKATCIEQEIEYLGIPDAAVPALGEKATRIAIRNYRAEQKATRRKARRVQEASRKLSRGKK